MSNKSSGCCAQTMTASRVSSNLTSNPKQKSGKESATKIIANIDCGFTNTLFIRGEGISSLSWNKGIKMKNIGPNQWVWESDRPFSTMQFKVLVNDNWYEVGNNHTVAFGQEVNFTPQF